MQNALVQAKAALRETAEARVRPVVRDASGGHTFGKPRLTALGAASVPLPGLFSHDRSKAVAGSFAAAALLTPVRQIVYAFPSAIFLGAGGARCPKCDNTDLATVQWDEAKTFVDFDGYGIAIAQRLRCKESVDAAGTRIKGCGITFSAANPEVRSLVRCICQPCANKFLKF